MKITISGYTNEGKTTMAVLIAKIIIKCGGIANIIDIDNTPFTLGEFLANKADIILKNKVINIEVIQLQKNHITPY
jgi:hypothetical protein